MSNKAMTYDNPVVGVSHKAAFDPALLAGDEKGGLYYDYPKGRGQFAQQLMSSFGLHKLRAH